MTPEGKVKAAVNRAMAKAFPEAYKFMPVQNGMGKQGLDYFWCIGGRFVSYETKRPGKDMTERQEDTAQEILGANGIVFVIHDPDEIEGAIRVLKSLTPVVQPVKRLYYARKG